MNGSLKIDEIDNYLVRAYLPSGEVFVGYFVRKRSTGVGEIAEIAANGRRVEVTLDRVAPKEPGDRPSGLSINVHKTGRALDISGMKAIDEPDEVL